MEFPIEGIAADADRLGYIADIPAMLHDQLQQHRPLMHLKRLELASCGFIAGQGLAGSSICGVRVAVVGSAQGVVFYRVRGKLRKRHGTQRQCRQMRATDGATVGQSQGSAQHMTKLTDVTRPRIRHQRLLCLRGQHGTGTTLSGQNIADQLGLVASLAQRWNQQFDAGQTVVQILAEAVFAYQRGQVLVAGTDELKLHRVGIFCTQRRDLTLVEHPQQSGLKFQWHVGYFVEEKRSPIGLQNLAAPATALRSGKGASTVAEQLGFNQGLGQAGAIDRNESATGIRTGGMHSAGKYLFAGTRFTTQQDRCLPGYNLTGGVQVRLQTRILEGVGWLARQHSANSGAHRGGRGVAAQRGHDGRRRS